MLKRIAHHAHRAFLILKNRNLPSPCLQPLLWMSNLCPHHEGEDSGSKVQKFMISGLQIPSGCSSKTAPSLTSGTMKYKYQVEKLRAAWEFSKHLWWRGDGHLEEVQWGKVPETRWPFRQYSLDPATYPGQYQPLELHRPIAGRPCQREHWPRKPLEIQ